MLDRSNSPSHIAHTASQIHPRSIIDALAGYLDAGEDESQHPSLYTVIIAIACVSAIATCVAIGVVVTKLIARRWQQSNKSYFNLDSVSSSDPPGAAWLSTKVSDQPAQMVAMEISSSRDSSSTPAAVSEKEGVDNREKNSNDASAGQDSKDKTIDIVKP
ncbi:hypothetical protein VTP01DRAFT_6271 [Rhizomucor pusillus]|uniref:uncharacterized protein n=1 Tax=Rhizomucor pusillus TaxID=4840 RepID=UPI0037422549